MKHISYKLDAFLVIQPTGLSHFEEEDSEVIDGTVLCT